MIFLFRQGPIRQKLYLIYKATRQHARNLGLFALVYKSTMLLLRQSSPTAKERQYDSMLAGLAGGYLVFGRAMHSSVNQQIVTYVFARVCLAVAKLAVKPAGPGPSGGWGLIRDDKTREIVVDNAWPMFAAVSWAAVMYLFRWHAETVQPSLRSSMNYM
jgi:Tim17/Tim22/Tim23/Pmp24 family